MLALSSHSMQSKLDGLAAGTVVFHRSGDKDVGLHGNSGLWRNAPDSHRIALVFYLTALQKALTSLPGQAQEMQAIAGAGEELKGGC